MFRNIQNTSEKQLITTCASEQPALPEGKGKSEECETIDGNENNVENIDDNLSLGSLGIETLEQSLSNILGGTEPETDRDGNPIVSEKGGGVSRLEQAAPNTKLDVGDTSEIPATMLDTVGTKANECDRASEMSPSLPAPSPSVPVEPQREARSGGSNFSEVDHPDPDPQRKLEEMPAVRCSRRPCPVLGKNANASSVKPWPSKQANLVESIMRPKQGIAHVTATPSTSECNAPANAMPPCDDMIDNIQEYPFLEAVKRPNKRMVSNMLDGLAFHDDALDFMDTDHDFFGDSAIDSLVQCAMDSDQDTMSTSFSGIESPHTAACAHRQALSRRLGKKIPYPRLLHMIEWDTACQGELLITAKETGSCLFSDIGSFFRPELHETIKSLRDNPAMCVEILGPLLASGRLMKSSAFCLAHQRMCCLKTASRHRAGTSCTPYSKRGVGLGLKDECTLHTMAWVGLRLLLQEPDITQETFSFNSAELIDY